MLRRPDLTDTLAGLGGFTHDDLVRHIERYVPVRRITSRGVLFDCPTCKRKRRLSVGEGEIGKHLIKCHAGCDTEQILAALDLAFHDLFPPPAYKPDAGHAPTKEVLKHVSRTSERWTVCTHDFGGDDELALIVDAYEAFLPARAKADLGHWPWTEFPFSLRFIVKLVRAATGRRISIRTAVRLRAKLVDANLIAATGCFLFLESSDQWTPLFRVAAFALKAWSLALGALSTGVPEKPPGSPDSAHRSCPTEVPSRVKRQLRALNQLLDEAGIHVRGSPARRTDGPLTLTQIVRRAAA